MATLLTPVPVAQGPRRKLWTRAECEELDAAGVFEHQHLELVEGELIDKMGKNGPHTASLAAIAVWLRRIFGDLFVLTEAPIDVAPEDNPTSEPEPDVIVLKRDFWAFTAGNNPRSEDLHLVVEVSDTTLSWDLSTKAALYARAGISEYWVLDVVARRLIVHRHPAEGIYKNILVQGRDEPIAPLAAPHAEFRPAAAFAG
jgi:Uma2 family endonuclease